MEKYTITYRRKSDIPEHQLQYYSPVNVGTLQRAGYRIEGFRESDTVYLNNESYKEFMNWQGYCQKAEEIDNTQQVEEVDNKKHVR